MKIHQFLSQRRPIWAELNAFVDTCAKTRMHQLPLETFQAGSLLYRQTVADLAYLRMRFPEHSALKELEALVGRAHSAIYQSRRSPKGSLRAFWTDAYPVSVRAAWKPILFAFLLFWVTAGLGFLGTLEIPSFGDYFVSPDMREGLARGELWTQKVTKVAPSASSAIAQNNITVCLLGWGLGVTFGIGTLYILVFNGVMLGAVIAVCMQYGMHRAILLFVVAHGSLELPAIWISSGAGLLMAQALVLPGRFGRGVELRLKGNQSVQISVGTVPFLMVAALVEGFLSPSAAPPGLKCAVACVLGLGFLTYLLTFGRERRATEAVVA